MGQIAGRMEHEPRTSRQEGKVIPCAETVPPGNPHHPVNPGDTDSLFRHGTNSGPGRSHRLRPKYRPCLDSTSDPLTPRRLHCRVTSGGDHLNAMPQTRGYQTSSPALLRGPEAPLMADVKEPATLPPGGVIISPEPGRLRSRTVPAVKTRNLVPETGR